MPGTAEEEGTGRPLWPAGEPPFPPGRSARLFRVCSWVPLVSGRRGPGKRLDSKPERVGTEVRVLRKRIFLAALLGAAAAAASAQTWGIGASAGVVSDIGRRFRLDEFKTRDYSAWVEYRLEDRVQLRGTFGSLKVAGAHSGETTAVGGAPVTLPEFRTRMDYVTVGTAYEFWEGDYTSGIFGGIGGYKVRPQAIAPELASFRDPPETAFGWHAGVDGSFRIVSRLSVVLRLTYHNVRSETARDILSANGGLVFRF